MSRRGSRLSASDWLAAGLDAISETGPEALKAEPLAVRLNVSKGSFYWHFRDVPDFHARLLDVWEAETGSKLAALLAREEQPAAQLRTLAQALTAPQASEPAIRNWAQNHPPAREAVERIDQARLEALLALLRASGIRNPEMARILYAAAVGMTQLGQAAPSDRTEAIGSMVDLVLALR
ncbi:MAG: helix-turn-helix domain-containing protein [Pseudomonadota bacterium]